MSESTTPKIIRTTAPCYVYDQAHVHERCMQLKDALTGFDFLYSVKTNPYPQILQEVKTAGFGLDAASANEVFMGMTQGFAATDIYYSAPGKSDRDIEMTMGKCRFIADSFHDIERLQALAQQKAMTVKFGVRLNPDFSMASDHGLPGKFGIDVEELPKLLEVLHACSNLELEGIHMHVRSQVLDANLIAAYWQKCFDLSARVEASLGVKLNYVNLGSGIGEVYETGRDRPIDLSVLSSKAKELVEKAQGRLRFIMETGRYIVCRAGVYYTPIVDIKVSRGVKYLIVKNALTGFIRPAIAHLVLSNNADAADGQEPLYTSPRPFEIRVENNSIETERVNLVGNLCTAMDVVANDIELKKAQVGDIVSITNAGSYAFSLSPHFFSSQAITRQLWKTRTGEYLDEHAQLIGHE